MTTTGISVYDNDRDFGQGVQALRKWEQQRDAQSNGGK
jgi:hypothetical protein